MEKHYSSDWTKKSFSAEKINIQITFKKTCYYLAAYNRAVYKIQ